MSKKTKNLFRKGSTEIKDHIN
jgi:hypothetical protein